MGFKYLNISLLQIHLGSKFFVIPELVLLVYLVMLSNVTFSTRKDNQVYKHGRYITRATEGSQETKVWRMYCGYLTHYCTCSLVLITLVKDSNGRDD